MPRRKKRPAPAAVPAPKSAPQPRPRPRPHTNTLESFLHHLGRTGSRRRSTSRRWSWVSTGRASPDIGDALALTGAAWDLPPVQAH